MEKKYVAIKWSDFALAKSFKEVAEKMGWIYNYKFNEFEEKDAVTCLFFSDDFSAYPERPAFSLSNPSGDFYTLPRQWDEAIAAISKLYREISGHNEQVQTLPPSLTKREWFAGMALQGFLASWGQHDSTDFDELASDAALLADAMLKRLEL